MIQIGFASLWNYILSGVGLFAVTFVVSLLVIAFVLVKIPPTYFLDSHNRDLWIDHHPWIRWSGILLKNCLAIGTIGIGILLCVLPGQGILTILIGLALLDFPGKRRLERAILRKKGIFDSINRLRQHYGKRPFMMEEPSPIEKVSSKVSMREK
ncbi:MAG: hypothetical protein JW829_11780 [Pirellulales bacterium]|nr:hypothetical protein [Pirellulales bacterium]